MVELAHCNLSSETRVARHAPLPFSFSFFFLCHWGSNSGPREFVYIANILKTVKSLRSTWKLADHHWYKLIVCTQ